ncbi:MAG: PhzF family phenazine biosynthesis protein [Myxococcota bacterium]
MALSEPSRRFWIVDAFSSVPLRGNPAAVVLDGDGLDTDAMQRIAAEFNLSETVFARAASDPAADYAVRIFTPKAELPFAGHPTLAAAFAVHESGWLGDVAPKTAGHLHQECGIGVVPVEIESADDATRFVMTQATPSHRPAGLDPESLAALLGCAAEDIAPGPIEVVSTGAPWCVAGLRSREAIEALAPNLPELAQWSAKAECEGITVFCDGAEAPDCRLRLRTFAPRHGITEDPVCGSGNGAVAAYVAAHGVGFTLPFRFWNEQGVEMGRGGRAYVEVDAGADGLRVRVGGFAARFAAGAL